MTKSLVTIIFWLANLAGTCQAHVVPRTRRNFLTSQAWLAAFFVELPAWASNSNQPATSPDVPTTPNSLQTFYYSPEWTGTNLEWQSMEQALAKPHWDMGRWPDATLRRHASEVPPHWLGTLDLQTLCRRLQETAQREGAVGLAAQQCGVDARMVYLEGFGVLVNPHIVSRSPEMEMKVWNEECLVLPPTFRATVLRDNWIDVLYTSRNGNKERVDRFQGEQSRCLQHELDHDRGILITDHVGLEELESDLMRQVEQRGHDERMTIAYDRYIDVGSA